MRRSIDVSLAIAALLATTLGTLLLLSVSCGGSIIIDDRDARGPDRDAAGDQPAATATAEAPPPQPALHR